MRLRHIHHIFFPIKDIISTRGIIRFGTTEITIYHKMGLSPIIGDELQKNISIHRLELPDSYHDAIEKINEDFEDILQEDTLIYINLDDSMPIITQSAILFLSQCLKRFHAKSRPCLGPFATGLYYNSIDGYLKGYPVVPPSPEICSTIFHILSKKQEWLSKKLIKNELNVYDETITDDKITNAMITLENWLSFYPGFNVRQMKQRKKEYLIQDLSSS